jgi:hypothetical protein
VLTKWVYIGRSHHEPEHPLCFLCIPSLPNHTLILDKYQKAKLGHFGSALDLNDWGCPRCKKTVTLKADDPVSSKYEQAL